jgi:ribonucleoside-diphosphate reductase beta chain
LSEALDLKNMDLKKAKSFFETRVIEYQNGGALEWD